MRKTKSSPSWNGLVGELTVVVALFLFFGGALLLSPGVVRTVVGGIGLLVLPGYAVTTLLFPCRGRFFARPGRGPRDTNAGAPQAALSDVERLALSFGLSVALVPLFGFVVATTTGGVSLWPALVTVVGFTILVLVGGGVRRARVADDHRYVLPLGRLIGFVKSGFSGRGADVAVNAFLAIAVVFATVGFAYAAVSPMRSAGLTEASLLTANENGELVAADYQTKLTAGQPADYVLAIDNQEGEVTQYTVVVEMQRIEDGDAVLSKEVKRLQNTVPHNETWLARHQVSSELLGDDLRLTYLIYRGEAPDTLTRESAYRSLSLWVDVSSEQGDVSAEHVVTEDSSLVAAE